jgi:hypothetical protein
MFYGRIGFDGIATAKTLCSWILGRYGLQVKRELDSVFIARKVLEWEHLEDDV